MSSWLSRKKKSPPIRSLIGEGMQLKGDIVFTDGMRIDGVVHGNVVGQGNDEGGGATLLVISDNAKVHGRVQAAHVIINGEVHGPVQSSELLELQPKARVTGDVRYELLEMHPGAQVAGELKPLQSVADKPALKLAASNEI